MRRGPRLGFARRYGASPLHLLAHLAGFAIVAFALDRIFSGGDAKVLIIWYLGFAIAHDLVFVPAYTGLDRLFRATIARRAASGPHRRPGDQLRARARGDLRGSF